MPISFNRYLTEIRPNLLYDVSKYALFVAVSILVGAAVFVYRFLLGYPRDLVLMGAISIGAFLLMTIAVFIARYARRTENEKLRQANATLSKEKHEVETRLEEALRQNKPPTPTINVPSILPCGDSQLHEIADHDRVSIEHLVTITVIDPQPNTLSRGVAYIEFIFYIFNSSVFEISIDDAIDGYIIPRGKPRGSSSRIQSAKRQSGQGCSESRRRPLHNLSTVD
jgi:hypothetical protein